MSAVDPTPPVEHRMECMEVWGGTEAIARRVRMHGLDAWVYSRPCGEASCGGDVYYASSCATGRIGRLLLADVSGHGSAVAEMSAGLRGLMRRFVNFIDQGRFVRALNEAFVAASPDGIYATAVVCTFFAPTNRLTVCNAGHPQPLWYRARDRRWSLLRQTADGPADELPHNMPLGIIDLVDYEQSDLELARGDLLVLYTDALSEARDPAGELLGEAGLLELVRSLGPVDPAGLLHALLAAVDRLNPRNLVADDVTIMLFRPTGRGSAPTLAAKVRGLTRLAVAVVTHLARPAAAPRPDLRLANIGGAVVPWLGRLWRAGGGRVTSPRPASPPRAGRGR